MKCFYCKGDLKQTGAAFTVELEDCIIVIKDVPTDVCQKCGQRSYSDPVAARIEEIANSMRNTFAEVAVVHYTANQVA
jgi:YgiT-type zinc finger domain-containing protein